MHVIWESVLAVIMLFVHIVSSSLTAIFVPSPGALPAQIVIWAAIAFALLRRRVRL